MEMMEIITHIMLEVMIPSARQYLLSVAPGIAQKTSLFTSNLYNLLSKFSSSVCKPNVTVSASVGRGGSFSSFNQE